jgi:hypothetical protein
VVDRPAGDLVGFDPLIEVDVAGALGLIEVPFGVPKVHFQHRVEVPGAPLSCRLSDSSASIK